MSKFEPYSQEWKDEMNKLPKQVIIEMFGFMAQDKDRQNMELTKINKRMLDLLSDDIEMLLITNNKIIESLSELKRKEVKDEVNKNTSQ